jgi:hypothetical protein
LEFKSSDTVTISQMILDTDPKRYAPNLTGSGRPRLIGSLREIVQDYPQE